MPVSAMESVAVPNNIRDLIVRKVEEGKISKKKLSKEIGISEPTFYKVLRTKKARVSVRTMALLHRFGEEKPQGKTSAGFADESIIGQHFNRRETATRVLDAVSAVLRSEMDAESKIFAATRIIGDDNQ